MSKEDIQKLENLYDIFSKALWNESEEVLGNDMIEIDRAKELLQNELIKLGCWQNEEVVRNMLREEAKSCICTIKMLQKLAYNIHGVMDVVDADNCKKIIKALEQEPCEDAISRQDTLKTIIKHLGISSEEYLLQAEEAIYKVVKNMPSVTPIQIWISVSERLPEKSGFYLVSTTDCITIMEFSNGWISQNIGSCNWYVKAWMPLPQAYKEGDGNDD